MTRPYYDSELVISIIRKNCNNPDDLAKIINACECMQELLSLPAAIEHPKPTLQQLLITEQTNV
jgi:hypothetical protein